MTKSKWWSSSSRRVLFKVVGSWLGWSGSPWIFTSRCRSYGLFRWRFSPWTAEGILFFIVGWSGILTTLFCSLLRLIIWWGWGVWGSRCIAYPALKLFLSSGSLFLRHSANVISWTLFPSPLRSCISSSSPWSFTHPHCLLTSTRPP